MQHTLQKSETTTPKTYASCCTLRKLCGSHFSVEAESVDAVFTIKPPITVIEPNYLCFNVIVISGSCLYDPICGERGSRERLTVTMI